MKVTRQLFAPNSLQAIRLSLQTTTDHYQYFKSVAKFKNQMPRDFTANSFKFSPDAINALVKHCRETASNGRWRDDDPRSRGLWIYVGAFMSVLGVRTTSNAPVKKEFM